MPSDPNRLRQALRHIDQIKAADYPAIVGRDDSYRIAERPWQDMPEASKLAILQDAVDWSGITNRDQAHILLSEIDPGKIGDSHRNRLIAMAASGMPTPDADEKPLSRVEMKALFAEWTADFAAARGRDELGAKPNERERGGIEF